eukprot:scaffold66_cov115-Cylindrotheca_fusiformis.AAC.21
MFWRTLYTNECVQRMSEQQIRSVFEHPLLADAEKPSQVEKCKTIAELKRMYRVHMLDIMSDISQNHHFYSDIQFGSYASSRVDAKRDSITLLELCNPFGFDMYFKIAREDVDETDQIEFASYEESEDILLYHYGVGYFDESCQFHMKLREEVHSNHHPTGTSNKCISSVSLFHLTCPFHQQAYWLTISSDCASIDLSWQWIDFGRKLQVGPYPLLTISRTCRWGWKMENIHAILLVRDKAAPEENDI